MTPSTFVDFVGETSSLVEVLRDAICNNEAHENTGHYWVLIDYITERLDKLKTALEQQAESL